MKKRLLSFIALVGMLVPTYAVFADYGDPGTYGGQYYTTGYRYVTDTDQCFANYGTGGSFDCAPNNVLTAYTGSNDPCRVSGAAAPSSGQITTDTTDAVAGGGYYFDCIGSDSGTTPDNWNCMQDTANTTNHIGTRCLGTGSSEAATSVANTDTNCLSGYMNCSVANGGGDSDNDTCESQKNVTDTDSIHGNTHFGTSCSTYVCDSGYISCNGLTTSTPDDDASGCESTTSQDTDNLTGGGNNTNTHRTSNCAVLACDSGYFVRSTETEEAEGCNGVIGESCSMNVTGFPGTCTGDGSTGTASGGGTCACSETAIPEFATGGFVDSDGAYTADIASFDTTNPLLWGQQTGSGILIQMTDSTDDWDTPFTETANITNGSDTFTASGTMAAKLKPGDRIRLNSDDDEIRVVKSVSGTTVVVTEDITTTNGTAAIEKDLPEFEVDNTGRITAGFIGSADLRTGGGTDGYVLGVSGGVPTWMSPGSLTVTGDNLGDHTATEALKLNGNKIIHGTTGTNGISVADSTGNVTMDGNLTVATGITVTTGGLTVSAGDLAVSSGDLTVSGTLTTSGTGVSTIAGDLTVSDGDLILGDADDAGTITLMDGNGKQLGLRPASSITSSYNLYFPDDAAVDGTGKYQTLTATHAGVMSWTNVVPDKGCVNGDVMKWNGSEWICADLVASTAQILDVAYDAGDADAASRTVAIDGDAIKFNGSHATNDVFQLTQTNASATGDVFELINSGLGNALVINDGTDDALVVDVDGNTIVKQLRLVASTANDTTGYPSSVTCTSSNVGDMTYSIRSNGRGNYYGCKETEDDSFAWVSMEVFGS